MVRKKALILNFRSNLNFDQKKIIYRKEVQPKLILKIAKKKYRVNKNYFNSPVKNEILNHIKYQ